MDPARKSADTRPPRSTASSASELAASSREATATLDDHRPDAIAQRRLAQMMVQGARPAAQRALDAGIHDSPRLVAQRRQWADAGLPVQREAAVNATGMPDALKAGVESLSGLDMSDVRVHRNSGRPAQLNAHAYAQGSEIHLAPGQEHQLPHEAWHVVQQKQGRVRATLQAKGVDINDDPALEQEADTMGSRAGVAGSAPPSLGALQARSAGPGPVQRVQADITVPDAEAEAGTRTMVVDASAELAEFDEPERSANGMAIPARPLATPANTAAYVANIVTTASGKDKTLAQVAAQYAAEAFDTPQDAARRFALAVLANREEKPGTPHDEQEAALAAASTDEAADIATFPAAAGRAFWRRKWYWGPQDGPLEEKTVDEIRTELDAASDPEAAHEAADAAARAAGLPPGVPNAARNKVRALPQTAAWVGTFATRGYRSFVHIADADAVTLKATPAVDGSGVAGSLFSRYDALLGTRPSAEVLAGGYRFAHRPDSEDDLPEHAAGAGDDGTGLMARTQQSIKTSELDMSVRAAMSGVDRSMPYLPEPNLVVRGDLYTAPGVGFGDEGAEWLKLKTSLVREGKTLRGAQEFARLQGEEIVLPSGTTMCKFPVASRAALLQVYQAPQVQQATMRRQDRRSGRWETVADPNRVVIFKSRDQISRKLGNQWADQKRFVFDRSAALVTDVGRFDRPYVETSGNEDEDRSGTDYLEGGTDPLALFDPARAHQSHAQWGAIKSTVEFAYGLQDVDQQAWLRSLMRLLLPQSLFHEIGETRESEGTLSERTEASVQRLAEVQPHLQHFAAFTAAVRVEVSDPTQLTARATARQGLDALLTAAHKRGAVADRLAAHGVNAGFRDLLGPPELLAIWDAATSAHKPANLAGVTGAVKAIGDAIARFLGTY